MEWVLLFVFFGVLGWVVLPSLLVVMGVRVARRHLLPEGSDGRKVRGQLGSGSSKGSHPGCPVREKETLRKLEKRLERARKQCLDALETRLTSELARARVAPPLEDAHAQIQAEIEAIYAFCARNDLVGTLKKANSSTSAKDIYLAAYERDFAKVQEAIAKTEECLAAYERTVATLEVSSVEADLGSDFDASIEMLKDLREELPRYSLEDRV